MAVAPCHFAPSAFTILNVKDGDHISLLLKKFSFKIIFHECISFPQFTVLQETETKTLQDSDNVDAILKLERKNFRSNDFKWLSLSKISFKAHLLALYIDRLLRAPVSMTVELGKHYIWIRTQGQSPCPRSHSLCPNQGASAQRSSMVPQSLASMNSQVS